jgi:hypothetical protein
MMIRRATITLNITLPVLLLAAIASAQSSGATPTGEPTQPLLLGGLTGCQLRCACKWRVTLKIRETPQIVQPNGPELPPLVSGMRRHRTQSARFGRPDLVADCLSYRDPFQGTTHHSELYGKTSRGFAEVRVEHLDMCAQCPDNAVFSGWSRPRTRLNARAGVDASYSIGVLMQAEFALLDGASSVLEFLEQANSGGYVGAVTMGMSFDGQLSANIGISAVGQTRTRTQPLDRLYAAPWAADNRKGVEEFMVIMGTVTSSARSHQGLLASSGASMKVFESSHGAGLRFRCVCGPSCHPAPPISPGGGSSGGGGGWNPLPPGSEVGSDFHGDSGGEVRDRVPDAPSSAASEELSGPVARPLSDG